MFYQNFNLTELVSSYKTFVSSAVSTVLTIVKLGFNNLDYLSLSIAFVFYLKNVSLSNKSQDNSHSPSPFTFFSLKLLLLHYISLFYYTFVFLYQNRNPFDDIERLILFSVIADLLLFSFFAISISKYPENTKKRYSFLSLFCILLYSYFSFTTRNVLMNLTVSYLSLCIFIKEVKLMYDEKSCFQQSNDNLT